MAMIRQEPFDAFVPLRDAMNRLIEDSFIGMGRFEPFGRAFPLDIQETTDEYIVEAALPGVKPDELQVTATEDTLTIKAVRKQEEKTDKSETYVRRERYTGELSRIVSLPMTIDPNRVNATYEHGVLTLHIAKQPKVAPKQITVNVNEAVSAPR
jgi:HSP20 family protein